MVHSSSGHGPCELPVSPHSNLPHRYRSSKATQSGPQLPPQHPHFPPALLRNDSCPLANWDPHSDRGAGLVRGWRCWEADESEVLPHWCGRGGGPAVGGLARGSLLCRHAVTLSTLSPLSPGLGHFPCLSHQVRPNPPLASGCLQLQLSLLRAHRLHRVGERPVVNLLLLFPWSPVLSH